MNGYIVYEAGGTCPICFGACEKFFMEKDKAIKYATSRIEDKSVFKIIVYKADENILNESHSIPPDKKNVVFNWNRI